MRKYLTVAGVLLAMSASQVMAETLLERGTYLMQGISGCGNCHTAKGGPMAKHELAGGFAMKKGPIDAITARSRHKKETFMRFYARRISDRQRAALGGHPSRGGLSME